MSPRNPGAEKTRFTLWLPDEMLEALTGVQRQTGKESVAEVIREAISVYCDLLKAREEGVELYFRHGKSGKSGPVWILPGPPPGLRRRR